MKKIKKYIQFFFCLVLLSSLYACSTAGNLGLISPYYDYGEYGNYGDQYFWTEHSSNLAYAHNLKKHGRFEIAKEYYLIALAEARTAEEKEWIDRELDIVDLQIRSRR